MSAVSIPFAELSLAEQLSLMPESEREAYFASLDRRETENLLTNWDFWGRPKQQLPPGDWISWLILAGRGWGKTRTGAQSIYQWKNQGYRRFTLVGRTAADVRDVMVKGPSGLLSVCPPWDMPVYKPSERMVTWPNGAVAYCYSADEPDMLRGPQCEKAWADELAAWRYVDAWDQLNLGLRLGDNPQVIVTTTPRPTQIIKDLIKAATTAVTSGSTFENARNLARTFISTIIARYEGTRMGRQEIYAAILDDVEGALWTLDVLETIRVKRPEDIPPMKRVVVAIDPAGTHKTESDETGITVCGKDFAGRGWLLEDLSLRGTPAEWGTAAVDAWKKHTAERIVAEANFGGEMVEHVIRSVDEKAGDAVKLVQASKGKHVRAEPIATLTEKDKIRLGGVFPILEDQLRAFTHEGYVGTGSPDRADAFVWGMSELMLGPGEPKLVLPFSITRESPWDNAG